MRNNQPVTQEETPFPAGKVIISRTDKRGHITHINQAFMDVSGYTEDELLGQPHNLLRHPDMPSEVFRDLWHTLKAGRPWSGILKNRCKNGDHYWVRASVSALPDAAGFMSVRTEAHRNEIQAAEALYARMRANSALRLQGGRLLPGGLLGTAIALNRHVRLAWRFWATFLVFALLMLIGCSFVFLSHRDLGSKLAEQADVHQPRALAYGDIYAQGLQTGQAIRNIILDPENPRAHDNLAAAEKAFDTALDEASRLASGDQERQLLGNIQMLWEKDKALKSRIQTLARSGDTSSATRLLNAEETPVWREMKDLILKQASDTRTQADSAVRETLANAASLRRLGELAVLGALIAGFAMFGAMIHYLAHNMHKTRDLLKGIAESGDLSAPLPISMYDEIGEVLTQIAVMRSKLHELIADLIDRVQSMGPGARDLSEAADTGARASQRQSQSAAAMASAIEQLSVSVDQMRDRAQESSTLASQSAQLAQNGSQIIRQAAEEISQIASAVQSSVDAVNTLEAHSERISSIVQVISEIADQTNLLALNAAIEAARAGESGRGFAVVADEVRKLAEKTMNATREVDTAIKGIQTSARSNIDNTRKATDAIEVGTGMVGKSGEILREIVRLVETTADSVRNIATASEEQSAASEQITRSTDEINRIASETADAMQQSARAVQDVASLADELHGVIEEMRRQ